MRKRKREIYRRGDAFLAWRTGQHGERIAVADYREHNSRRRRADLGANLTEDQARKALDRFCDARTALDEQRKRPTVGELWTLWLASRAKNKLSNAVYEANWVSLGPYFSGRDADLVKEDDWRAYAEMRFEAGRSSWTVHTELARLRTCLRWAKHNRLVQYDPMSWLPSRGDARDRVLTVDEMRALVTAAGDPHIHLFIVLAFATGARHTAILDLTWDRVDFRAGTIQYDTKEKKDPMSRSWKKGRATVLMGSRVRAELERAKSAAVTDHVIEHGGRRLKTVRSGFANAVKRAGLSEDITPHTIRHTVSTWLKQRGVGLEERAQLLGHTDSRTTDVIYSHADATYLSGAVSVLDTELAALPQKARPERVAEGNLSPKK